MNYHVTTTELVLLETIQLCAFYQISFRDSARFHLPPRIPPPLIKGPRNRAVNASIVLYMPIIA